MNESVIICEERWSYVVFQLGEAVYLTFLTGGVAEVDHTVLLCESEALDIKNNSAFAIELVRRLNSNQQELLARELTSPIWPTRA